MQSLRTQRVRPVPVNPIAFSESVGFEVGRAFDGSTTTDWESAAACTSGVTWIGWDFGNAPQTVRTIRLYQSASATFSPNSIIVEYSADGSSWTAISDGAKAVTTGDQIVSINDNGSRRYWRLLANQTVAGVWSVFAIEPRWA